MRREGECKHFNGIQNDECKLKVNYRALAGGDNVGWAARLPCIINSLTKEPISTCQSKQEYTKEEIAAQKAENKMWTDYMLAAIKTIRAQPQAHHGIIDCPKCGCKLAYTIAKINGHIWGSCSTKGCLQWMM